MESDTVHVWMESVKQGERAASRYAPLLSSDEQDRLARYASAARAAQFVTGRGALRLILAGLVGLPPSDLRFTENERGKPALADHGGYHFNVAHAKERVLIAVTRVGPVGVDLEAIRPIARREQIARRWFSDEDIAQLRQAARDGRDDPDAAFLRLWTRKEALLKAWGIGLSWGRARTLTVSGDRVGARPVSVVGANRSPLDGEQGWSIRSWSPRPGFIAAVAAPGDAWRLLENATSDGHEQRNP